MFNWPLFSDPHFSANLDTRDKNSFTINKRMIQALDIIVYSLNVMKIQYTEQQYNALETVWYIQDRSSDVLRRMRMTWKVVPFLFPQQHAHVSLGLLWPFQNSSTE